MADATPKTIVITGASSGIGKATARLFLDKGWNVVATMRNPAAEKDLKEQARLKLIALDVQDPEGPKAAVAEAIKAYGRIDVWLNNAGYGAFGPVEAGRREEIERQFDVNVFGLIACVQAIAPHFRERKAGVLINISSIGGIMTVPAYAVYNATKFAVEGLSEGLWYELGTFGIKVKVIEPGAIKTDFGGRSQDVWDVSRVPAYAPFMDKVNAARARYIENSSSPETVAEIIYRAATDPSDRMRYPVGRRCASLDPAPPAARRRRHDENDQAKVRAIVSIRASRSAHAGRTLRGRRRAQAFFVGRRRHRLHRRRAARARPERADPAHSWLRLEPSHQLGQPTLGRDSDRRPGAASWRSTTAATDKAKSSTRPPTIALDLMTRDAANLLAHLGIERADVMGYSMGARIASFLALG